jgi:peptidylprolyl isomerase
MFYENLKNKPIYILVAVIIIIGLVSVIYLAANNNMSQKSNVPPAGNESHISNASAEVAPGDTVSVFYTGTLTNGTVFDSNVGKEPLQFTVGSGEVIQGFDEGVIGMKVNQTKTVTIPANEAYGEVNPEMIISVPISNFGNETLKVGMDVSATSSNGQELQGVVKSFNSTNATIDFNPPLAGQTLIFEIKVVEITQKT